MMDVEWAAVDEVADALISLDVVADDGAVAFEFINGKELLEDMSGDRVFEAEEDGLRKRVGLILRGAIGQVEKDKEGKFDVESGVVD